MNALLFDAGSQSKDEARLARKRRQGQKTLLHVVGAVGIAMIAFAILMVPAILSARASARRMLLSNQLKNIVLAMHNYHDQHGSFPPAYIADENGQPMHSWRVLLLAAMPEPGPWRNYDFSQPWDSPKNLEVAAQVPPIYRNPYARGSGKTCFVLVAGEGSAFEGGRAPSLGGRLSEALVAESSADEFAWTAPVDLDLATLSGEINTGAQGQLNSRLKDGVTVAYRDGRVGVVSKDVAAEKVRMLFTAGQQ